MANRLFHRRRGFTLSEFAIVLGITGMILAGIWQAASYAYLNLRVNKTVQQLATIVSNTRALYGLNGNMVQPNFTYITTNMLNAGVFPTDMPVINGTPHNLFGGAMAIESQGNCGGPYTLGSCDATSFEVEFFPPPGGQNPCAAIITRIIGSGRDPGLLAVYSDSNGWMDPVTMTINTISRNCTYVSLAYKLRTN